MNGYAKGFADIQEQAPQELAWQGECPSWLSGTLFRNGPGRYDRGKTQVNHWFDGLALLHGLRISPEKVVYLSRFVRSREYRVSQLEGTIAAPGFDSDPCRSLFRKVVGAFTLDATDNPNINLVKLGNDFLALTELPLPMRFDPETLHSLGPVRYRDTVPDGSTTAHPHKLGPHLYNQVLHYSARSSYRFYRQSELHNRQEFARLPVNEVSYVHSFGMTQHHIVLTCCPFQVAPWKLLLRNRPFIENFEWKPQEGTRFHLIPLPGVQGETLTLKAEPFFAFHHVNSFEDPSGAVTVDLIGYPDVEIISQLKLPRLREEQPIPFGRLRRYRIDPRTRTIARLWESKHFLELTRIDYSQDHTREYRYVYGVSAAEGSVFYDRLARLNVTDDSALYWFEEGTYPGEPILVCSPDGKSRVLLSVVLSAEQDRSFLLVLRADDLHELARAWLPVPVPHGFHGLFEPA